MLPKFGATNTGNSIGVDHLPMMDSGFNPNGYGPDS